MYELLTPLDRKRIGTLLRQGATIGVNPEYIQEFVEVMPFSRVKSRRADSLIHVMNGSTLYILPPDEKTAYAAYYGYTLPEMRSYANQNTENSSWKKGTLPLIAVFI